uniref:ABC transporter G family member 9-like n=1 Tax=Saccoglossus kowalevskii TaxID=10224 RepID=A0ABM0MSS8_SACKO|nr:PREDICTED: ABC transporter G family member 9-like [Saccoglossus kowalevskii]
MAFLVHGSYYHKGCSEPTSGLDSSTAYTLLSILKNYAVTTRKTVIISVHQPSSSMFYMFDKLLLMHQGETVYFGKANNVVDYFDSIGFQCEQHYNPADFILDKVRGNESEVETIMAASRNALWESYSNGETMVTNSYIDESNNGHIKYCSNENSVNMKHTNDLDDDFDDDSEPKWSTTYFEQYRTLTSRSFKESKIPGERVVINKERLSGLYRLSAYFLAKQTSELPIGTLIPAMSYVIIYWAGGLNRTWPPAFVFSLALVLLGSLVGQVSTPVYINPQYPNF